MGKSRARGRIGDADQDLAAGALDLSAGETHLALQRLVAVRAVELELRGNSIVAHHVLMRKKAEKGIKLYFTDGVIPFGGGLRMEGRYAVASSHERFRGF